MIGIVLEVFNKAEDKLENKYFFNKSAVIGTAVSDLSMLIDLSTGTSFDIEHLDDQYYVVTKQLCGEIILKSSPLYDLNSVFDQIFVENYCLDLAD